MKKNIHPKFNSQSSIICNTCKTTYILGSTVEGIRVELCANCHPFYTGKQMLVDSDNLVEKFNKKRTAAQTTTQSLVNKKQKRLEKRKLAAAGSKPITLKDMLSQIK